MSKQQRIEELSQELSALREQKNKLDVEASELAEQRDSLNQKFKNLRAEIGELKSERDKANETVNELKQKRSETKVKVHEKIEELKKLRRDAATLSSRKPSRDFLSLQKEFESMEWRIQTTPLSLQEEKELIEQVKQVETQLNVYKKLDQISRKVFELETGIKICRNESEAYHARLTEIAQKSQEIHQKMLAEIERSKKTKDEADALHSSFVRVKEKTKPILQEMDAIFGQMTHMKGEIHEEAEKQRRLSEQTLRDRLREQAKEKLMQGKKLTLEEFQMLGENDDVAQD